MKSSLKTLMFKCALTMIVLLCAPFAIQGFAQTNIYLGQFTVGGGYSTMVTAMNTGSTDTNGTVSFTDQQGNPFTVRVSFPEGSFTTSSPVLPPIRPGGTDSVTLSSVNPGDPIKSGWIRVEYTGGSLRAVATFLLTEGGTLKAIAGVLSSQPSPFATIPVDNSVAANRFTGFAVVNQNSSSLSLRLVTLDENGAIVDNVLPSQLNLGPRAQTAIFLHQILTNRVNFNGSMVLVGQGGNFVVVALVVDQGLLTVIPAVPEKAPHVPN